MFENGVDSEAEREKKIFCNEFKTGRPDPNMICKNRLENPFDEAIFEEQSVKKSFSVWKGNFGSTSQICNRFSLDDVETWKLSCKDLLALADGSAKTSSDFCGNRGEFGHGAVGLAQQSGRLNLLYDLNLPPEMMAELAVNTGLSLQCTALTPDQAKRLNLAADKEVVEANQDSEKGLSEQADLNETPQPKQKRRKLRLKVITEGKPRRASKPATPKPETPNPDSSSTSVCNKEDGTQRSNDEIKHSNGHGVRKCRDSLESFLSICTDFNNGNLNSSAISKETGKAPAMPKNGYMQTSDDSFESYLSVYTDYNSWILNSSEINKKKDKAPAMLKNRYVQTPGDSLESYLSVYTDYNSWILNSSEINKKKGKAPAMPKNGYMQTSCQVIVSPKNV